MHNYLAKKSLGQNFLMHPATAERIVHAADLPKGASVLEIGPGTGMLTRALLSEGCVVTAVEADGGLAQELTQTFAQEIKTKQLKLVHEDIRLFNMSSLPKTYSLVANIPYYITGEIIRTFLTAKQKPLSMTLLVQKEVAERITGRGEKHPKESLLSLSVKAYGVSKYCFTVPKGAFRPAPKVDSAVISIQGIRKDAFKNLKEEESFFELLKTGFAHKRKILLNNLALKYGLEKVKGAFETTKIPPKVRSEELSLEDWRALLKQLS